MGGLALVVDQRGATLEAGNHDTLVVRDHQGRTERVGLRALASVVINGDVMVSTHLLRKLASVGVAISMLPIRGRTESVGFTCLPWRAARLRHGQHLLYANAELRLALARRVVEAKIQMQTGTAAKWGRMLPAQSARGDVARVRTIASLMGVEGAVAAAYFEALRTQVPATWGFSNRRRRPASDPFNALLSLGYTLATAEMSRLALRFGLDVELGYLHALGRMRPSLSLDLLEPVRPVIDTWVLALIDNAAERPIEVTDFTSSASEGCKLDKAARTVFYRQWFAQAQPLVLAAARPLLARVLRAARQAGAGSKAANEELANDEPSWRVEDDLDDETLNLTE